ncbi:MAG: hypothetical protein IT168_06725 [Bryobacterales bacterium]|nr:hypothetical protein [Bryobacterales bacterium]
MDLTKYIRELLRERDRLDEAIATLERLIEENPALASTRRRGRKSMNPTERREVSKRMRAYWEKRRKEQIRKPPEAANAATA